MMNKLLFILTLILFTILGGCSSDKKDEYIIEVNAWKHEKIDTYKDIQKGDIVTVVIEFDEGKYKTQDQINVEVVSIEAVEGLLSTKYKIKIIATKDQMKKLNKSDNYQITKHS